MRQQENRSIFHSGFLAIKRALVLLVIAAIAVFAFFGESMPQSVKSALTRFTGENYGENENDMIPPRFRIEKHSEIQEIAPTKSQHIPPLVPAKLETATVIHSRVVDLQYDNMKIDDFAIAGLHEELKNLGAISCQLTHWGETEKMYRFSCHMPISDRNSNLTRMFQSIAPDATQSMREVIDQVKQWQANR